MCCPPGCEDHLGRRGHVGVGVTEQPCGQKQRIDTRERELGVSSSTKPQCNRFKWRAGSESSVCHGQERWVFSTRVTIVCRYHLAALAQIQSGRELCLFQEKCLMYLRYRKIEELGWGAGAYPLILAVERPTAFSLSPA